MCSSFYQMICLNLKSKQGSVYRANFLQMNVSRATKAAPDFVVRTKDGAVKLIEATPRDP